MLYFSSSLYSVKAATKAGSDSASLLVFPSSLYRWRTLRMRRTVFFISTRLMLVAVFLMKRRHLALFCQSMGG